MSSLTSPDDEQILQSAKHNFISSRSSSFIAEMMCILSAEFPSTCVQEAHRRVEALTKIYNVHSNSFSD